MGDPLTVLFVDDEQPLREVVQRILERGGFRVRIAADGAEAMRILSEGAHIDVIVSDIVMPKLNGVEMLMALHEKWPRLRAVVISGRVDVGASSIQNLAPLMSSESACMLRKPFEPEQLIGAVKRAAAGACGDPG